MCEPASYTGMSPGFYRDEAQRTRRLAAEEIDPRLVQQILRAAAEYDDLADDLEQSVRRPGKPH
jgi:hypothetical protein